MRVLSAHWRWLLASAAIAVGMLIPASAVAATADIIAPQNDPHTPADGWQAGTCTSDDPECSVATPGQFFKKSSGHPQVGFTQFTVKYTEGPLETKNPVGVLSKVRVDLPHGLTVNPQATEQCAAVSDPGSCAGSAPGSQVGVSAVTLSVAGVVTPPVEGLSKVPVYNLVPEDGEPALFGLTLAGNNVYLKADVDWDGDYHEGFTIDVPAPPLGTRILTNRLTFNGRAGDGTFISTPSTCFDPEQPGFEGVYSTWLLAASYEEEESAGYAFPPSAEPPVESPLPEGEKPIDCGNVPYDPSLDVDPSQPATDSPSGAITKVDVPHITGGDERESSHTRRAEVTLPAGMGLNPSAANGLVACTDAQFGKGTTNPIACPPASRVGSVTIETPPLPPGSLTGDAYIGEQLSRDPASGDAYRLFVAAGSDRYGISARLLGKVIANPQTGQLTTVFNDPRLGKAPLPGLPQVPFSSFVIDFNDGPRAPLTSPPICGPHTTSTSLTPWTGNPAANPDDDFTLTSSPAGGACPVTMAARPFAPGFKAATDNPRGGSYSPFGIGITRVDGEQELKGTTVDLPPGLTAKLAGLTYCPESALVAAAGNSGAAEAAAASCPSSSLVGTATAHSGSGPEPIQLAGRVFLAGKYAGAPLSLAIVTPATAGPFDLGSVVLRVALVVDRETVQVHAVSDPIPHVFGGALLDIRSVDVRLDRKGFSLNPTNCSPTAVGATLRGGGANPSDPAAFTAFPASAPFLLSGCERLGFKPKLKLRLFGAKRRAKNPKLRAVLRARSGDANIRRAVVTLPKSLILDQSSIAKVCTRVQFDARACPKKSVYGFARAFTPLLDNPLEGPVRLRSSDNLLPDLVASLQGQIDVDLVGRIDTDKNGRIRNTFSTVPDVPVSKFELTVRGGKKGLLTNSRRLCGKGAKKLRAIVRLRAQNGKKANSRPVVSKPCGKKGK